MKVIIYRSQLLALSETFIRQQLLALRRWTPVLVGERLVEGGLDLCDLNLKVLDKPRWRLLGQIRLWLCRSLWLPHAPTVLTMSSVGADLIHVHFGTDAVDIWPSVHRLGLPMLVTLHGYDINIHRRWWESGQGGAHRRRYPRRLLKMAQSPRVQFIAVSKAIKSRAVEYGIPPEKVTVRYIGVDTNEFSPRGLPISQRAKQVLFVGRLVEKKGLEFLIRAFVAIKATVPEAELVVVGNGPLRRSLELLAESLNVRPVFLGSLTTDQIKQQMMYARVLCLPSIIADNGDAEGFGMVLLEAQACGIPVVSSARGGCDEGILDGVTGIRIPAQNCEALTAAIQLILTDDDLAETLSTSAVQFAKSAFEISSCTRQLEMDYEDNVMRQKQARAHGALK